MSVYVCQNPIFFLDQVFRDIHLWWKERNGIKVVFAFPSSKLWGRLMVRGLYGVCVWEVDGMH
jgi:hypothetical protein